MLHACDGLPILDLLERLINQIYDTIERILNVEPLGSRAIMYTVTFIIGIGAVGALQSFTVQWDD